MELLLHALLDSLAGERKLHSSIGGELLRICWHSFVAALARGRWWSDSGWSVWSRSWRHICHASQPSLLLKMLCLLLRCHFRGLLSCEPRAVWRGQRKSNAYGSTTIVTVILVIFLLILFIILLLLA